MSARVGGSSAFHAAPLAASSPWANVPDEAPVGRVRVGVITPYDFALDRELWRWVPDEVTLHLTRTPHAPLPVSLEQATVVPTSSPSAPRT